MDESFRRLEHLGNEMEDVRADMFKLKEESNRLK